MTPQQQITFIKENYIRLSPRKLAAEIGRSRTFVRSVIKKHKLVVPDDIMEERIRASQFQKGQPSMNKGLKPEEYMSPAALEKIRKTQFKKGHLPHNTKKDGAISIRKHKRTGQAYKYIRIAKGEWVLLHRHMWEQQEGPIPPGYNCQFIDKDTMNCDIDNLYLINRKHQVIINNRVNRGQLPFHLIDSAILISKLNQKIKSCETN